MLRDRAKTLGRVTFAKDNPVQNLRLNVGHIVTERELLLWLIEHLEETEPFSLAPRTLTNHCDHFVKALVDDLPINFTSPTVYRVRHALSKGGEGGWRRSEALLYCLSALGSELERRLHAHPEIHWRDQTGAERLSDAIMFAIDAWSEQVRYLQIRPLRQGAMSIQSSVAGTLEFQVLIDVTIKPSMRMVDRW